LPGNCDSTLFLKECPKYPKFFWLLLFFVPLLTLVPYISLRFLAPSGSQFTGFMYASDDLETYLANWYLRTCSFLMRL
jgi:hypothetical protein